MLKIQLNFPKLYRGLLYVVSHNLEFYYAVLVDFKKDLNYKISKGNFVRKNLKKKISKINIVIKKVTGSEVTLTHKADRPSNYFPALSHIIRLSR